MKNKKLLIGLMIFVLWAAYVSAASYLVYKYQHSPGEDLYDLTFFFGPVIKNIVTTNFASISGGSTHRMPFVSYFLALIASVNNNLLFAYIVKNFIFFFLISLSCYVAGRHLKNINRRAVFIMLCLGLSFPQLILHTFSIEYEEGYIAAFALILFTYLLFAREFKNKYIFIFPALVNFLLFLTKGSMIFLSIAVCFLYYLVTRRIRIFLLFAAFLMAAFLIWGFSNLCNSGKFIILNSQNGYTFYKGNNELTLSVYPEYGVDLLSGAASGIIPKKEPLGVWELNRFYTLKGFEFIKTRPLDAFRLFLSRFYVFFIRPGHINPEDARSWPILKRIDQFYMLIFRFIFWICIYLSAKNIFLKNTRGLSERGAGPAAISFAYIGFILAYSVPYLLAWAWERHMMPLIPVTFLYLLWNLRRPSNNETAKGETIC